MSANDKQVGGDHYVKTGEQHWDRMWRLYGRGYFIGCATKYAERYHLKNGKQDLEKAIHFLQKLIELEYPEADEQLTARTNQPTHVFTYGDKVAMVRTREEAYEGDATRAYVAQD